MLKKTFKKGSVILREGEIGNRLIVVISGTVDIYKGNVLVATQSIPGGVYGEMSVLLKDPHSATVMASTEVTAIEVPDADKFLKAKPSTCYKVSVTLARRLRAITLQVAELRTSDQNQVTADILEEAELAALQNQPCSFDQDEAYYEVEIYMPGDDDESSGHLR